MFGRLKDWRRVATRYDRCPKVFLSAIALAATVIYWLGVLTLITRWRRIANVSHADDGREKSLNDTRGTAATKLLNAGPSLAQIANFMGWSVRYAANVIEHYAMVSPSESDEILIKLEAAKELENLQEL